MQTANFFTFVQNVYNSNVAYLSGELLPLSSKMTLFYVMHKVHMQMQTKSQKSWLNYTMDLLLNRTMVVFMSLTQLITTNK